MPEAYSANRPVRFKTSLLAASIAMATSFSATQVLAQDTAQADVEEIVVTGSYIRRSEGFTAASPVTQMTNEDLEAQGTVNMAQVVQNLTFNNGSGVTSSIQGTSDQTSTFNLRGLGSRATLQLVDGKRVATDNVQALLPGIAVQRIDIVTDGAAALYGTDAVAGVVNMVPYSSYEGLEIEYYQEGDSRGDFSDHQTSIIGGTRLSDNISVVGAASFRKQGELRWHDRPKLMKSGLTQNSGSHPGNFIVPERDDNGLLTGVEGGRPDPTCGIVEEDPAQSGANPYGMLLGGRCWMDFGDTRNLRNKQNISQFYGNFDYNVSPDLNLSAQLIHSRQSTQYRENRSNPGGRVDDLPVVRGELPGNNFRAINAEGQELYAEPRRDEAGNIMTDGHGNPLPHRDDDGQVVLAANQFASMEADAQGGVPFYEDVKLGAWSPFGKTNLVPSGFNGDGTNPAERDWRNTRLSLTADFTVPYLPDWNGTAFYTYAQRRDTSRDSQSFSFSALESGLNCDVINDAGSCFNPFGVTDSRYLNSQALTDSVWTKHRRNNLDVLQTFNLVFNGDLPLGGFQLPGGAIGSAFGYQRRQEEIDDTPSLSRITGDSYNYNQMDPYSISRSVDAWFAEVLFPVLPNLEVTGAMRKETFSTGQGDTIGKLGFVYEPLDWLGLRATWGEAFIAPTLSQTNSPESCGLSNVEDMFSTFQGWVTSCQEGNSNLISETSESMTAGIDLMPLDGLTLSATWSETDFVDRIVSTTSQDTMRQDFANFQQATGFDPGPDDASPPEEMVRQWIADPRSDPRIVRSPADIGTIQKITQSDSNASSMLVRAWDFQLDYQLPYTDWGQFGFNTQATFFDTYQFQLSQDDPAQEAVGNQNDSYGAVPAVPEWRANARLSWSLENHNLSTTVRYTDDVVFDANDYSFQAGFPFSTYREVDTIRAWTQVDAFYTYRDIQVPMMGGNLSLTAGVRNLFDREAQKTGMIAGVVAELQDPLGRVLYGRMSYEF